MRDENGEEKGGGVAIVSRRWRSPVPSELKFKESWRSTEMSVARAAAHGASVADLATLVLEGLDELFALREGRFLLLSDETLTLHTSRPAASETTRVLLSTSLASLARQRGEPVQAVVAAAAQDFPSLGAYDPAYSVLVVPVHVEEATFGFFELARVGAFTPAETALGSSLAGMVAIALLRERRLAQITRHGEALEARIRQSQDELTRTQEQLLQAAKLSTIGEIAAGLVHEINQPLNVLGGYVELLREGRIGDAQRGRALEVMNRAVERITGLVDNLRTFARVGGPLMEPVEVAAVATMARDLTAGAHRRSVPVDCPANLYVRGNAARLEQVIINLIANALQSEGDPVRVVGVVLDEDRVAIEVHDRGPGVPAEIRHRIFEPFFTTRPPGQGTGLGLSISARIVQEHGGRIEVDDNPLGGAIFRVVLPRCHPTPAS